MSPLDNSTNAEVYDLRYWNRQ